MTQLVTPVLRGLDLLEWLAAGGSLDNLSDVARETGINRATLSRLLATFTEAGVLEPVPGPIRFGPRMLRIATDLLRSSDLPRAAAETLPALAQRLGLSAYLVVPDGDHALFLQQHLPDVGLVTNVRVGSRIPALQVAPGRVLLAGDPAAQTNAAQTSAAGGKAAEAESGLEGLERAAGHEPETLAALRIPQDTDAPRPVAWSRSGLEEGITAAATAVCQGGRTVAAISVAGSEGRLAPKRRHSVESALREAALAIEARLL